ncbi:MAG TPA: aminopeptidase [Candidatus Faecimonas gallistercoris]|nr:aminopeptidase [Candidatus Faecimonas gallistercoris]
MNGKDILVNFPTAEVFISPDCMSAEGVVVSSKPLVYQDIIIDKFKLVFKEGKVIKLHTNVGEDITHQLQILIKSS